MSELLDQGCTTQNAVRAIFDFYSSTADRSLIIAVTNGAGAIVALTTPSATAGREHGSRGPRVVHPCPWRSGLTHRWRSNFKAGCKLQKFWIGKSDGHHGISQNSFVVHLKTTDRNTRQKMMAVKAI